MRAQTQVEVQLTMTHAEAAWLREVMQSPLHNTGEPEAAVDAVNRQAFWTALNNVLTVIGPVRQ